MALTFVHLSDIHFRKLDASGRAVENADIRNELLIDLKKLGLRAAGVLVTGDVAFSGAASEYEIARSWLAEVSGAVKADPENVWVVPGNHDVNWKAIADSPILMDVQRTIRTAQAADVDSFIAKYVVEEKTNPEMLFSPIKDYLSFASIYSCDHKPNQPIWTDNVSLGDQSTLRIVGLNSTMVSNKYDDDGANRLVVGSAQLQFPREDRVAYLVLCHHPPQWLKDQDQVHDKLKERAQIQLFGHKHSQRCEEIDGKSVRLVAGAMHPDKREPEWSPVYNVLHLNVARVGAQSRLDVKVQPRVWSKLGFKFDEDAGENGGIRVFQLPLDSWTANEHPSEAQRASTMHVRPPAEGSTMTPRRLTYEFLSLPFTKQMEVAQKVGLLEPEDKGIQDQKLFQLFFARARTKGLVDKLETAIELAKNQ